MSDDEDRGRPSWRDLDRRRDRSRHVSEEPREPRSKGRREASDRAKRAYMKQLDKLFDSKGGTAEQRGLASQIREGIGSEGFEASCDEFLRKFGLPSDWDLLVAFLDHKNTDVVAETIRAIDRRIESGEEGNKDLLRRKLRILSMSGGSDEVEELAEEILERF